MDTLEFTCEAITVDGKFQRQFTGRGEDSSPEFVINNLSPDAKTFIVTLEDLSHPIKNFTHWVIWNIPAATNIPRAIPCGKFIASLDNAVQGIGYGVHRYAGPKPPQGKTHRYRFTVYALDCSLGLKSFCFKGKVLKLAREHIIQKGELCGYFE